MKQSFKQIGITHILGIIILLVLLFNPFILARTVGYVQLPGEMSRIDIAREAARMAVDLNEQLARDMDVFETSAVRDVIAQFKYEVDRANTAEDIVTYITDYSLKVQEVITREQESKRRDTVLSIINQDPRLSAHKGEDIISVWKGEDGIRIVDPTNLLTDETKARLHEHPILQGPSWSLIELSVKNGQVSLMTSRSMLDKLRMLENDKVNLERRLKQIKSQAGYSDISGTGIIVEMYDSDIGFSSIDIVHDRDVRDVVNELFAAGARGISVGGQRLIATSSIRCAGPIILVNQKPIAVDPIVIHAVGDAQILKSSLELIKGELREFGIRIEVRVEEIITLPAYSE
ncbi:DUF881 domain-containing protein [Desulfitibacter alkalitolerans]|uniref:DUF881 domain-containing protein n=1 Tax=Desulfitibacter alkalitolerans TaxID=264641 RepID=UPI000685BFC0|nr:DUF881 domain-containing protein [Desulfitibacter alkalitolerans]